MLENFQEIPASYIKRGMTFVMFGQECFVIHAKPNLRGMMVIRFITVDDNNENIEEEYVRTTVPVEILVVPLDREIELIPASE